MSPQEVRKGLHIPPNMQQAYDKVVAAGMQIMFDEKTRDRVMAEIQRPGDWSEKLGRSIAGLMMLMVQKSNNTIPPMVIIPAGMELMAHAVDFLNQAGEQVPDTEFAEGAALMIETLLKQFGVDPDKVMQMVSQFDKTEAA